MRKLMIWFCLTLVCVTLLLISLAGCDFCVLGDACSAGVMSGPQATMTSAANELHIQLTQLAEGK